MAAVSLTLDVELWAEENFGTCELGDERRTRRVVNMVRCMAEHPDGSTPDQFENWKDLKAAYRLLSRPEVTFAALAEPHWRGTRAAARGSAPAAIVADVNDPAPVFVGTVPVLSSRTGWSTRRQATSA